MNPLPSVVVALVAIAALLFAPGVLEGQETTAPRQMRHFWHVFAAYAIAWVLLFGWAVSIARRIGRLERRVGGGEGT